MNRTPPRILVVGTGSSGGIGRFERLLMAALQDLSQQGVFQVDSIWRRRHPTYLQVGADNQLQEKGHAVETKMPLFVAQIARAVIRHRPDLVLFLHVNLARAALVTRLLGARRYAIVTYGVEVWSPLDQLRRHALEGASEVLAISQYTADQLERHQRLRRGRARVIPLALDPQWLETATSNLSRNDSSALHRRAPTLLSVSRLEPAARDKDIDQVIRALAEVRTAIPEIRYHIVGDGEDRAYLERIARESGVGDVVVFRGLLAHDDLIEEYRQANAFVLPSQREGFGLVFLEAMAYAKPVIARRAAAAVEVIVDGHTGILVDNTDGLAPAIISVLRDPTRAATMGQAGLDRVREIYSFDIFTSRVAAALLAATA